jgi:integrase
VHSVSAAIGTWNLSVRRKKNGSPATHPIQGDTLRALRKLRREAPNARFVFLSERGTPFSTSGFSKMVTRAAASAGLGR